MIRSTIVFFLESVAFQLRDRMLSSLKNYQHFLDLGVEIALSHRHVEKRLSGKTNTAIDGLGADDTATPNITECLQD